MGNPSSSAFPRPVTHYRDGTGEMRPLRAVHAAVGGSESRAFQLQAANAFALVVTQDGGELLACGSFAHLFARDGATAGGGGGGGGRGAAPVLSSPVFTLIRPALASSAAAAGGLRTVAAGAWCAAATDAQGGVYLCSGYDREGFSSAPVNPEGIPCRGAVSCGIAHAVWAEGEAGAGAVVVAEPTGAAGALETRRVMLGSGGDGDGDGDGSSDSDDKTARAVSASAGAFHCAAVAADGSLYTFASRPINEVAKTLEDNSSMHARPHSVRVQALAGVHLRGGANSSESPRAVVPSTGAAPETDKLNVAAAGGARSMAYSLVSQAATSQSLAAAAAAARRESLALASAVAIGGPGGASLAVALEGRAVDSKGRWAPAVVTRCLVAAKGESGDGAEAEGKSNGPSLSSPSASTPLAWAAGGSGVAIGKAAVEALRLRASCVSLTTGALVTLGHTGDGGGAGAGAGAGVGGGAGLELSLFPAPRAAGSRRGRSSAPSANAMDSLPIPLLQPEVSLTLRAARAARVLLGAAEGAGAGAGAGAATAAIAAVRALALASPADRAVMQLGDASSIVMILRWGVRALERAATASAAASRAAADIAEGTESKESVKGGGGAKATAAAKAASAAAARAASEGAFASRTCALALGRVSLGEQRRERREERRERR